jgi:hypothetical protein
LGGRVHAIKKNREALVVASKETGLEANVDDSKYIVMSQDRNAGRSHNTKTDNRFFQRLEQLLYLGITLTNQHSSQEELKSRFKSGNPCYLSMPNLLSLSLPSTNIKIETYRNIILPAVLYGCKIWSLTLREKRRLKVFLE